MSPRLAVVSLVAAAALACGGGGGGNPNNVPASGAGAQRYLPLAVGNAWTYTIVDTSTGSTVTSTKTNTAEALEDVGGTKAGIMAYRMKTTRPGANTAENISWQEDTGTAVIRHLDKSYDTGGALLSSETYSPSKLRIDEAGTHETVGASWTETYDEEAYDAATGNTVTNTKTETWTVISIDDPVTVPAGSFTCLKVHRVSSVNGGAGSDKTFWFAKGIGKVKELGASRTEELASYVLN